MMTIRKAAERGHANHGWLDSYHTFSFADYYDPEHLGFRALRVINDDRIAPGTGFGTHPHRDMEILTYVLDGSLEHKDSMGHVTVIRPGEVQRMTAGTGITHSETNASQSDPLRLLQIWIIPEEQRLVPSYEQKRYFTKEPEDGLRLVASRDGRDGSLEVHQDVSVLAARLEDGVSVSHAMEPGRHAWVQVARGAVRVNEDLLAEGDGAAISEEQQIMLKAEGPAEVLLFDMA